MSTTALFWLACAKNDPAPHAAQEVVEEAVATATAEAEEAAPEPTETTEPELPISGTGQPPFQVGGPGRQMLPPDADPTQVYEACRERVEGPEAAGECTTDADCVAVGCSQEMCVATTQSGLVSTCERLPCFSVLDACGCVEGLCSWSVKAPEPVTPEGSPEGEGANGAESQPAGDGAEAPQ